MPSETANQSRLVARIPAKLRRTIEAAAELEGTSLNQFVVRAAHREAQEILERENLLRLNHAETQRVFALLDKPPKPVRALLAAKAAFEKTVRA